MRASERASSSGGSQNKNHPSQRACVQGCCPAAAARALAWPTSKKEGETPWTNSVSCRGSACTASDSLITLWQWMRHTQELMCRSSA